MKNVFFALFFFGVLFFFNTSVSHSQSVSDFTKSTLVSTVHRDFDVLLLDFTIPDNNGSSDVLEAITLKNESSAGFEVVQSLYLWSDQGQSDFQGLTIDKKLGTFNWNSAVNGWVLSDLNVKIPKGGLRVFVSSDLKGIVPLQAYLKVRPHALDDNNKNGRYDIGDLGIFVESNNDGASVTVQKYNEIFIARKSDSLGPGIFSTNLFNNGTAVLAKNEFHITGIARDHGDSGVAYIRLKMDTATVVGDWVTSALTGPDISKMYTWEHIFENLQLNTPYTLTIESIDTVANKTTSKLENIVFKNATPVENNQQVIKKVSPTLSRVFANRSLAIRAPFEDTDIYVKVQIRGEDGLPIPNKLVTITATRPGKSIEMTLRTDEIGESFWAITSTVDNTFVFSVRVDDITLPETAKITFIDARLQGELIKGESSKTVYLLRDGKRYVFPTQSVYNSYYRDFNSVRVVSDSMLAEYPLGGNLTYSPGSLIKIPSLSKVYRVGLDKKIYWIQSENDARLMYGPAWASLVHDVSDTFFTNYIIE